ncbi:YqaA family protein [Ghiorsea bivora]|uniref:YqaA family protein n=1 Tax=Ghiorsea bivora TaxID=1485545 RepID=UPI00056E1697|nr:YqaA family protein [Ghiorsea bivora]
MQEHTRKLSWLRRLYHWTLSWADHPSAKYALFLIALIESSVFPIPPDILLIALALGQPKSALRFAAITTAGSTLGAAVGYGIGFLLWASVGQPIIEFYGLTSQYLKAEDWFAMYGVAIVLIAGFSPIPFKVITIAAGAFGIAFIPFILAALAARGARFFLEAAILRWGGDRLRNFVEKHFELMTILITLLVVAGFVVIWAMG